jgi:hypothetical protein
LTLAISRKKTAPCNFQSKDDSCNGDDIRKGLTVYGNIVYTASARKVSADASVLVNDQYLFRDPKKSTVLDSSLRRRTLERPG